MLIKDVIKRYGDSVRLVNDNWGESRLAERYGIRRYPAVFVDGALIARPADFGFLGLEGRYAPFNEPANRERFRRDLLRMIESALRGEGFAASAEPIQPLGSPLPETLPAFCAVDVGGNDIVSAELAGRVAVVEFWATWCAPCGPALGFLGEELSRHGADLEVVAVQSDEEEVSEFAASLGGGLRVVVGTDEIGAAFGGIVAVPTTFIFDRNGNLATVIYGAPEDLHGRLRQLLRRLIAAGQGN